MQSIPTQVFYIVNKIKGTIFLRIHNTYKFKDGLGCDQSDANFSEIHPQPAVWLLVYIFGVLVIPWRHPIENDFTHIQQSYKACIKHWNG